jgi:hypothetical protein
LIWPVERRDPRVAEACQKAAAHGRGALALLRAPVRAPCLARHMCSGASRTSQKRRPATCSARSRPALAAEALAAERRRWPAVPTPRRAGPRADGAVASHTDPRRAKTT